MSIPPAGLEPAVPASDWTYNHALDRAAIIVLINFTWEYLLKLNTVKAKSQHKTRKMRAEYEKPLSHTK